MKKKIMALIIAASVITVSGCGKTEASVELLPSDSGTTSTEAVAANTDNSSVSSAEENNERTNEPAAVDNSEPTSEPASVQTEETTMQEADIADFEYLEENGEITITKYVGESNDIVFPATIDGKPVTKIGYIYGSMRHAEVVAGSRFKSAVIPEGVTTIEAGAFREAEGLVDLIIPESATNFGYYEGGRGGVTPFEGTLWLKNKREENPLVIVNNIVIDGQKCTRSVDIPDGVTEILGNAFKGCTTITDVTLPKSLEKIGGRAFKNCFRLMSIDIPDSVYAIGDEAFYGCEALEDVTFPDRIVEMGAVIFEDTPWLDNKQKENPLVIISGNLIDASRCKGDVVVPNSVKSIAPCAFGNINDEWGADVTSVELPDGIKKIPDYLFRMCFSLESIMIPDGVTEIGFEAFYYCVALKNVTLPDSVTIIEKNAFFMCNRIENLTIPNSVTEIRAHAFDDCGKLTDIVIPDSVEIIGDEAFANCGSLVSVTLPDNLVSLGKKAFTNTDITYKGEIYFPELYNELYEAINGKAE